MRILLNSCDEALERFSIGHRGFLADAVAGSSISYEPSDQALAIMCVPPKAEIVHGRSRVKFAMNAGAQVLPPSGEYDSSKWWESGVISDHVPRTRIDRPLKLSWEKSSPRPFLNSPISGDTTTPLLLLAND